MDFGGSIILRSHLFPISVLKWLFKLTRTRLPVSCYWMFQQPSKKANQKIDLCNDFLLIWSDMVKLYLSSRISKRVWNFCSRTPDFTQPIFSLFISPVSLKNCSWIHLGKVGCGSLPGCRWPPGWHYILSMGFQPKPSFATRSSEGATPKEDLSHWIFFKLKQPLCWDWKCWDGSWVPPESSRWFW